MPEHNDACMIFDFDLTLFDLKLDRKVMIARLRRATDALGVSSLVTSWHSAFKAYNELADDCLLEDPDRERIKRRLDQAMAAGEYEAYPRVEVYPGVNEALRLLCSRGHRLGIVSSNSLRIIESVSRKFGIWRFFDSVWGRESYGRAKPAPDKLRGCANQLGGNRPIYIGDDPTDMDAAVSASCIGVGVIRVTDRLPTASPAELKDRGARAIVWGVRDLPGVLDTLLTDS